jgi:murein DD-endopeptidase MepM/ murein hydrolase activator NlpD
LPKDFAERISSSATSPRPDQQADHFQPSMKRRFNLQSLSRIPFRWPAHGLLAGVACLLLVWALAGGGSSGVASTGIPHEEWIGAELVQEAPVALPWKREPIRKGDAASPVLLRMGYSHKEVNDILQAAKPVYSLAKVQAGRYFVQRGGDAGSSLYYPVDDDRVLYLSMHDNTWKAELRPRTAFSRSQVHEGVITDNLFSDAARAGMDDRTTMNLVDVFAWDIDFVRDLRSGDSFRVLTEDRYDAEGRLIGSVIKAAEFVNQGQTYRAIRYTLPDGSPGYYSPDGKNLRKTYLKAPVKYTRISSRFQLHRFHPILGYTRAHKGVDYAAPIGTPIHAVGDGRVMFAGWKGGYGRFVLIRHLNSSQSTGYGHMSAFAKGIRMGARVRQGQVIGYVGMSGLATGPHLHFEFRINGRPVNPLTIKREPAAPVPVAQMARFRMISEQYLQAMAPGRNLAWG